MLNAAMNKTLKKSRNDQTIMNERNMPFRVTYNGVLFNVEAKKRKGIYEAANAAKRKKLN